ncbi:ATP-binding protein [Slackia exigua]|uniref:ATP-binding protein n=1 Tax=Slackia exigua TaxID=84109 RepID=UPI0023F09514|nr:ATP-binding protein [Slackia exigua]
MDWTLGGAVLVEIHNDDIEIDSPGWSIEGQDPEDHLNGQSRSSRTRNPPIAKTLFRSGDIE